MLCLVAELTGRRHRLETFLILAHSTRHPLRKATPHTRPIQNNRIQYAAIADALRLLLLNRDSRLAAGGLPRTPECEVEAHAAELGVFSLFQLGNAMEVEARCAAPNDDITVA